MTAMTAKRDKQGEIIKLLNFIDVINKLNSNLYLLLFESLILNLASARSYPTVIYWWNSNKMLSSIYSSSRHIIFIAIHIPAYRLLMMQ